MHLSMYSPTHQNVKCPIVGQALCQIPYQTATSARVEGGGVVGQHIDRCIMDINKLMRTRGTETARGYYTVAKQFRIHLNHSTAALFL